MQPTCRTDWDETWLLKKQFPSPPARSDKNVFTIQICLQANSCQHIARNFINPVVISSRGFFVPPSHKYWVPAVVFTWQQDRKMWDVGPGLQRKAEQQWHKYLPFSPYRKCLVIPVHGYGHQSLPWQPEQLQWALSASYNLNLKYAPKAWRDTVAQNV